MRRGILIGIIAGITFSFFGCSKGLEKAELIIGLELKSDNVTCLKEVMENESGYTFRGGTSKDNDFLMKTTKKGEKVWNYEYEDIIDSEITLEDNIILAKYSLGRDIGDEKAEIIKIDGDGKTLFKKDLEIKNLDAIKDLIVLKDGSYLMMVSLKESGHLCAINISNQGKIKYKKEINIETKKSEKLIVNELKSGDFIIGTNVLNKDTKVIEGTIYKFSKDFNLVWKEVISKSTTIDDIAIDGDNIFIMFSEITGETKNKVRKLNSDGKEVFTKEAFVEGFNLDISTNPKSNKLYVVGTLKGKKGEEIRVLEILKENGKEISCKYVENDKEFFIKDTYMNVDEELLLVGGYYKDGKFTNASYLKLK